MRQVQYDATLGVVIVDKHESGGSITTVLPSLEILRLVDQEKALFTMLEGTPGKTLAEKVEWLIDHQLGKGLR